MLVTDSYDYYQHNHCIAISFDKVRVYLGRIFNNKKRQSLANNTTKQRACLLYYKDKKSTIVWGDEALHQKCHKKKHHLNSVYMDTFLQDLLDNRLNINAVALKAISDFLGLFIGEAERKWEVKAGNSPKNSFPHFVFLVPSGWEDEDHQKLIRSIFIQAKLIEEDDHINRLLFFTKPETIFKLFQHPQYIPELGLHQGIEKHQQYMLCRLKLKGQELSVTLDLVHFDNPFKLPVIDNSLIFNLLKSVSFRVSLDNDISNSIRTCLAARGLINESVHFEELQSNLVGLFRRTISEIVVDEEKPGYNGNPPHEKLTEICPFKKLKIAFGALTDEQIQACRLISIGDIYADIISSVKKTFLDSRKTLLTYGSIKIVTAVSVFDDFRVSLKDENNDDASKLISSILFDQMNTVVSVHDTRDTPMKYNVMTFKHTKSSTYIMTNWELFMLGIELQVINKTRISNFCRPPKTLTKFCENRRRSALRPASAVECKKTKYVINLDISSESVKFFCTKVCDSTSAHKIIVNSECDIKPLDSFFEQKYPYRRKWLKITESMQSYMKKNFYDALGEEWSKYGQVPALTRKKSTCTMRKGENMMKNYHKKDDIPNSFFSKTHKTNEPTIELICYQKIIKVFFIMYLEFISQLIKKQLNQHFCNDWKSKEIDYVITIEKLVLDSMIGTKDDFKDLLFASGLLCEMNKSSKPKIFTQGEDLLPAIQKRTLLKNLSIKEFFFLVQLHKNYIQITLNQVIQLESQEENASSIIICDEIIPIENVQDTLCKNFWRVIEESDNTMIKHCDKHRDLYTLQAKKNFMAKLKHQISQIFVSNISPLQLDENNILSISDACDCCVNLSIRNILVVGIRPVIQNITDIIANTMKSSLFDKYSVYHLIVVGNPFDIPQASTLYSSYTKIIESSFESSAQTRGKYIEYHVLGESLYQLLLSRITDSPFIYQNFPNGTLQQVSNETYGIYIRNIYMELDSDCKHSNPSLASVKDEIPRSTFQGKYNPMVIYEKGQKMPDKEFVKQLYISYPNCHQDHELVKLKCQDDILLVENDLSKNQEWERVAIFKLASPMQNFNIPITLKMTPINHTCTLQFSLKSTGHADNFKNSHQSFDVGEPLTLMSL